MSEIAKGEILFYRPADGKQIDVRLSDDTVWLSQQQMAALFETSRTNVIEHIGNIYAEGELDEKATCRDFRQVRQEGKRQVARTQPFYNLDLILSLGYRVKSKTATQFRQWASARLKDYLVKGYALNNERLQELGKIVNVLARTDNELASGIAEIISRYLPSLQLLREYDEGAIANAAGSAPKWQLTIEDARAIIATMRQRFPQDALAGKERGAQLEGIIAAIYQGFGDEDVYPTIEKKAANLLYLVVKDHPLLDGNKRTAAALFVSFLAQNGMATHKDGSARIHNATLAAITLLIAASQPPEKELMIALTERLIADDEAQP